MNKRRSKFYQMFFERSSAYIGISIATVIGFLLVWWIRQFALFGIVDGFFVMGFIMVATAGLSALSNEGMFRGLSYSGKYIVTKFSGKELPRYYEYCEMKEESKEKNKYKFGPYLFSGCILIIISFVLYVIFN